MEAEVGDLVMELGVILGVVCGQSLVVQVIMRGLKVKLVLQE